MLNPKLELLEKGFKASVLTPVHHPALRQKKIELWIKRDDLIHPVISGNKWRKLKFILDHALNIGSDAVISMGGAYSNHLHALAYIGKQLNLKTVGYIRGEQPKTYSPTLLDIQRWGMELRFLSRSEYRELRTYKQHNELPASQPGQYWLPEGGATSLALKGVAAISSEINLEYDVLCVPCGTGTTLAGLVNSMHRKTSILGFSALKGGGFLNRDVENLLDKKINNWSLILDYHFGGFAKGNEDLTLFMQNFYQQHGVELDAVYTGKMFYGLFDLILRDRFKPGQKIIAIHTGGLQGNRKNH